MYVDHHLESCILDTTLHFLGKEIDPRKREVMRPELWSPGGQLIRFVLGNHVPRSPAQPPDIEAALEDGHQGGRVLRYPS